MIITEGQAFIATAWWMCVFPGLAIAALALGFSLLADVDWPGAAGLKHEAVCCVQDLSIDFATLTGGWRRTGG